MFDESKHPRDELGRFTDGGTKTYRQNTPYEEILQEDIRCRYTPQIEILKESKDIVEYARRVINCEVTAPKAIVGYISERERRAIEQLTGEPLNALYHTISKNEILHIHNRHGENGKADHSMAKIEDYKKIIDTIHYFDDIHYVFTKDGEIKTSPRYRDKYNKPSRLIQFKKELEGHIVYVVEMVTDGREKDIKVLTAYQSIKK